MAGFNSNYLTGAQDQLKDVTPLSVAEEQALKDRSGAERFRTDSTVSDTGQYNRLTEPSQSSTTSTPSNYSSPLDGGNAGNPDYYIYDKESYDESYAVPQAKSLFGANLDVLATLGDEDNIQFEAMGDSSLRNAIAYIVPWQRASSSSRTQSASSVVNAPRTDFLQGMIDGLSPDFGFADPGYLDNINAGIDPSSVINWNGDAWQSGDFFNTGLDFFTGDDNKYNFNSEYYTKIINTDAEDQVTLDQSAGEKRQAAVSSEIPMGWRQGILAGGRFLAEELIEDTGTRGLVDTALTQGAGLLNTPTGPVYIGNANGLVNQVLDIATMFGVNVPRGLTTSVPPNLQSNRSKLEGFAVKAKPTNGMWQFLFNPSEIALSAGPKFKTTETWGVSDEANSGQPLHWTNNSNTKLQFSKVLLNGYIFGKKVESLEQGLFKLFLENPTNDAKHGPKVLEFVWGKRSFGPCVIKDIRVNEKMWDEGCLVSADVSFTLEKVPEWTINDGQVSTFDPTAHPVSAPPTKTTSEEARQPDAEDKAQPPAANRPICKKLATAVKDSVQLLKEFDYLAKEAASNMNPLKFFTWDIAAIPAFEKSFSMYSNWLQRVQLADSSTTYPSKCGREYFGQKRTELGLQPGAINGKEKKAFSEKIILEMKSCVSTVSKSPINAYAEGDCKAFESGNGKIVKYEIPDIN